MVAARTVWFSFHSGCHRWAVSLSALNVSPLTQITALMWGSDPLIQFPHPPRAGPVLLTLLFFPPSSFILPSFGWFYVFFSTGQVLLSALSWCSACTSASEGVFLMYPWRESYSTSTCYFTILFSPQNIGNSDTCYSMDETWRHAKWNKPVIRFSHSSVWLFETPGTAAHQASLSINKSWSLLKFMSIKLEFQLQH